VTDVDDLVWQEPGNAKRWHIFDEDDDRERSLCRNWSLSTDGGAKVAFGYEQVQESDEFKQGRDCKVCAREADLLDEDDDGGDDE